MTQLFFQPFCTKKWPNFFFNLFALKMTKLFFQSFCTKKWPNFFFKFLTLKSDQHFLFFLKIPGKKLGALPRSQKCGGWRVEVGGWYGHFFILIYQVVCITYHKKSYLIRELLWGPISKHNITQVLYSIKHFFCFIDPQ